MSASTKQNQFVLPELIGDKCCLKAWSLEFVQSITKHANNEKVAGNLLALPYPYKEEDAINFITTVLNDEIMAKRFFAICVDVDGKLEAIGGIGVDLNCGYKRHRVEIGYWIGEEYWGRGIVPEAIRLMISYLYSNDFKTHVNEGQEVKRIDACIFAWNANSGKVLEKCGFVCEGLQKSAYLKNGKYVDGLMYTLVRE